MKGSILLIDDEAEIRRLTGRLLTGTGRIITEAANGVEGLEKIATQEISLIVLDYQMPIMDGLAFLTELRNNLKSEIPVLMMSGAGDAELRRRCYKLGVYDFIDKPESADILQARVENGLKIAELLEYQRATERDMRISAAIIAKLGIPAEISGRHFRLKTTMKSYVPVGGDICLAFGTDSERPVFLIADITGHGISAALFSVFVGVAARRAYRESLTPQKILARLNRELAEYLPVSYFVTMFCWSYDAARGEITYANAGHPSPFVSTGGKTIQLATATNPALGIRAHQEYPAENITFQRGDWLIAYTDGLLDLFQGATYALDTTLADLAFAGSGAAEIFSRMSEYLELQTDFIDDRSVMVFSAE